MKNPLTFILSSVFLFTLSLVEGLFSISAFADVVSLPIYGGGQMFISTGSISIDKKVLNPETQKMVDNLSINDPKHKPLDTINFQISLTNTSNTEIKHIDVKDIFPQFVSFSNGLGNFDANTKTLSFEVSNLKANETKSFVVVGKVVEENSLPINQGIVCTVNQATATASDAGMSQDNAQFCIQKLPLVLPASTTKGGYQTVLPKGGFPVLPAPAITTSPATGGELLPIIFLIPTGIVGFFLRKKAINPFDKLRVNAERSRSIKNK